MFFFLEYLFSLRRYLRFCVMPIRKVMTSLVVPLKQHNTQPRISLEILQQCSSNLAPETNITKERKWHPLCCHHDSSYAAGPVLIKTKIPRFYLKQGSSTPNNLIRRDKTIWETCVFGERPSVPLLRVGNGDIWFSTERDWSQECYHGSNLEGVILFLLWSTFLVPSLKNTAPVFLEILLIECCIVLVEPDLWSHHFPHLHNTKTQTSQWRKKDIPKRKTPFFFTLKDHSNKQQLFFTS